MHALPTLPKLASYRFYRFLHINVQKDGCLDRNRLRWWILIATALNYTHKVIAAAMFGFFGFHAESLAQTSVLIAMQVSHVYHVSQDQIIK